MERRSSIAHGVNDMNFFRVLRITLVQIMLGCVALSACVCASATERYTDAALMGSELLGDINS